MSVVVRRYIDILIIIINFPYSTCISSFFGSIIPISLFIFKCSFILVVPRVNRIRPSIAYELHARTRGEPMRSFSRRIAGFTLVRYVYTWARAVEMAAVLVRRVYLQSYARIRTRRTMAKASH